MISHWKRELILSALLAAAIALIFGLFGPAYTLRMLVEAGCYAILALGLTIQIGYAGLYNAGVLGFIAIGGYMTVLLSFPPNERFWNSAGPAALGGMIVHVLITVAIVIAISQIHRLGVPKRVRTVCTIIAGLVGFVLFNNALYPVAQLIEREADYIGGFGLPVGVGWIFAGLAAGCVAYGIGKICLGLRSDYLAIATLGIAGIIHAILKNADWLTRGTQSVSPLPWPVPTPNEIGFVAARAAYLSLTAVIVAVIFIALQRAYKSPWGRLMRAIRDNEISAAAMGKDINFRRLEIFVLGAVLIGVGGAALVTSVRIFDPSSFHPLQYTFLVWVMVIIGGAGSNAGAILGAVGIYIIWTLSQPIALFIFEYVAIYGKQWFDWEPPSDLTSRALQARVFVIGLTISLALRFLPAGLVPERVREVS